MPLQFPAALTLVPSVIFEDVEGAQHALSDYRGRFVILNIWATWCPSCAKEMASLDLLQDKFDTQKLIVLPLSENVDNGAVEAFFRLQGIKRLPIMYDVAMRARSVLHLQGLPTTLIIDPRGLEVARVEGDLNWAGEEMLGFLRDKMKDN